eukprot:Gb_21612 [translate_table: standard]
MSSTVATRSSKKGRQSIFYRDLATPPRTDFSSQGHTTSSLWRHHSFGGADPPPPPILSLEDRLESPPDMPVGEPEFKSPTKTNFISFNSYRSTSANVQGEATPSRADFQTPGGSDWRSPVLERSDDGEREQDTHMADDGRQQQSPGLLILPPPAETVRPESEGNGTPDSKEWVTVYGFSPHDTNLVLREFEKCGMILKHVPGPGGANWVHILYQNFYDTQKALQKNGMQINASLIVGVKPVDPLQRQALAEKVNTGFMVLPPRSPGKVKRSSRPYYLQQPNEGGQRFSGAIASPCKSTISRIVDLIFGI